MDYDILICFHWSSHSEQGCVDHITNMNKHIANLISRQRLFPTPPPSPRRWCAKDHSESDFLTSRPYNSIDWFDGLCAFINQLALIHTQILHFLLNTDEKFNSIVAGGRGHGSQLTGG